MVEIIGLFAIGSAFIIGVPVGLSLIIFIIRRLFLSITGEARRTPAKDTLESSFGCVFMTIVYIAITIWIITLI